MSMYELQVSGQWISVYGTDRESASENALREFGEAANLTTIRLREPNPVEYYADGNAVIEVLDDGSHTEVIVTASEQAAERIVGKLNARLAEIQ